VIEHLVSLGRRLAGRDPVQPAAGGRASAAASLPETSPAGSAPASAGPPPVARKRTLIVIPAHNEEENIVEVLDELASLGLGHDVLVVDDASRDRTRDVLQRRGQRYVRLCTNLGYGGAVQTGFKYAVEHGYDHVVQMDGDCQHDPASIPALLEPVLAGETDVALGSRFLGKLCYDVPVLRRLGIGLFRTVVSFFMKQKITDPTSGFQALDRKVLEFFTDDTYPLDYPDSDVLLALHFAGFRIREVPVVMRPRTRGQSIHGGWKTFYYLAKMFLAIFMVLLRHFRRKVR
jgi:glycosyltransferase involved in cell wall biosynthesis